MKTLTMAICAMALFLGLSEVALSNVPETKVEYSATSVTEVGGVKTTARVHSAPGMERIEQGSGKDSRTLIIRMDKGLAWVLYDGAKEYMEHRLGHGTLDKALPKLDKSVLGVEEVNGVVAIKSAISANRADGQTLDGLIWETKDGVMVKLDAYSLGEGLPIRVQSELKDLTIGAQARSLFEVPPGYTQVEAGDFEGFRLQGAY